MSFLSFGSVEIFSVKTTWSVFPTPRIYFPHGSTKQTKNEKELLLKTFKVLVSPFFLIKQHKWWCFHALFTANTSDPLAPLAFPVCFPQCVNLGTNGRKLAAHYWASVYSETWYGVSSTRPLNTRRRIHIFLQEKKNRAVQFCRLALLYSSEINAMLYPLRVSLPLKKRCDMSSEGCAA
jgi:hypothetical protein